MAERAVAARVDSYRQRDSVAGNRLIGKKLSKRYRPALPLQHHPADSIPPKVKRSRWQQALQALQSLLVWHTSLRAVRPVALPSCPLSYGPAQRWVASLTFSPS